MALALWGIFSIEMHYQTFMISPDLTALFEDKKNLHKTLVLKMKVLRMG